MKVTPTDYLGALLPLPVRVLGTRLQPFSLGHRLILERLSSPLVAGGPVQIPDLILGIIICSRSPLKAWAALDSFRSLWHARTLGWRARISGVDYLSTLTAFRDYMTAGSLMPQFWQGENYKRIAVPLTVLVKVFLQKELGYTHETAMAKPWGAALHEYAVALNLAGKLDLVDETEADFMNNAQPPSQEEMNILQKAAHGV